MKINIASVLKNEGASMDFSGTTEMGSFTFMGSPIEFAEDVSVKGTVLKFLCSEDCKGLCPVCGTNLNKGECNCDTAVCDPRFAILRNLQQRGVENGSSEEKNF